jgi:hypothetical protein
MTASAVASLGGMEGEAAATLRSIAGGMLERVM